MFKDWLPDEVYESVFVMDFKGYYEAGYRCVLFDTDNTLVGHDAPADKRAVGFMSALRQMGFKCMIISNNTEERVAPFAREVGCGYEFLCRKPGAEGFLRAMERLGVSREETMMVGDQLFTDIWGAHRAGIRAVYTKPLGPDPLLQIKLKRIAEKIVFLFYKDNR